MSFKLSKVIIDDHGLSGAAVVRPGLSEVLAKLKKDDVLVVWRLDRLGRSLGHLIEIIAGLGNTGVGFASLTESIDTTTAGGRLVFHMMGALAEFERSLIGERTKAGMKAAKRRGKHLGRPPKLTRQQVQHAKELINSGKERRGAVAELFGVDVKTVCRSTNFRFGSAEAKLQHSLLRFDEPTGYCRRTTFARFAAFGLPN